MHRPGWYRALLALWGLWFTTALTEPAGIMACAMHGALPGASAHGRHGDTEHTQDTANVRVAAEASAHAAHAAPVAGTAHSSSAVEPVVERDPSPASDSHQCCTCIGQCCAATTAAPPVQSIALSATALRAAPARDFSRRERVPSPRAYVLPFANAPPAADA